MCKAWEEQVKDAGEAVNPVIDSIVAKEDGLELRGGIGFALDVVLVESTDPMAALRYAAATALGDNPPQKAVGYPDENAVALRDAIKEHDEFAVISALASRLKTEVPESKELIISMLAESYFRRVQRAVERPEAQDPFAALNALFAGVLSGDTSDETDEQDDDTDEAEEDEQDFRDEFESFDDGDTEPLRSGVARL